MNSDIAPKVLQFLNVLIKQVLRAQDFKQIGKLPKFFQQNKRVDIPRHNLEMWPGYLTQSRLLSDGIFLNVDTATKFIQKETILELIRKQMERGWSREQIAKQFDSSNVDVPRRTVITSYNIKSYQIDGLDWDLNPRNYFFEVKKNNIIEKLSMAEYLTRQYQVKLREENQPLLFVNFRDTRIYLPPELCREASLPENFTSDSRKMRDLQEYKISHPEQRMKRIQEIINKLGEAGQFSQFDIQLSAQEHKVNGKVLFQPMLHSQRGQSFWDEYTNRKIPHSEPTRLEKDKWVLIYSDQDYDRANKCFDMMKQASNSFGIRVDEPFWCEVPD